MISIGKDNIALFAATNEKSLRGRIRSVVFEFHGLGYTGLDDINGNDTAGADGILRILPYYGPWSWMNKESVAYVDAVLGAVIDKYGLSARIPVVSTGGSMGGLSSLIYARYSAHTPVAAASNCPVCDLVYHATERDDLPRTVLAAFSHYECGIDKAIERNSPMHQIKYMPKIKYLIVHGGGDTAVNKEKHSDPFVAGMRAAGHDVGYIEVPGMKHCELDFDPDVKKRYYEFIYGFAR
ncbi:MAG: prolyl oligopeptidase family serine peptidase [Clostridiales bacterium]|jgi:dipeptidyl aminopeptidase/acylaminoacyl peptidase|nr:prolyl oligopeptidase family serine peptidase [Clostridiales bacterium]